MDRRTLSLALLLIGALTAIVGASCSVVQNQRIGIDAPPYSEASFGPVGDYLGERCGTLDCHGQTSRNLQIYSCTGLRLDGGVPYCSRAQGGSATTAAEHEATYRSLVGLEPQVMTTVFDGCDSPDGGYPPAASCHPELLTFIRKARGTEAHKGGQLICATEPCPIAGDTPPDDQEICLVTWLEGATDVQSCINAQQFPSFPQPDASAE